MISKLPKHLFDWQRWRAGSPDVIGIGCRGFDIMSDHGKKKLRQYAVGHCQAEHLLCRPKNENQAVMFFKDGEHFWFHLRNEEFRSVFNEDPCLGERG